MITGRKQQGWRVVGSSDYATGQELDSDDATAATREATTSSEQIPKTTGLALPMWRTHVNSAQDREYPRHARARVVLVPLPRGAGVRLVVVVVGQSESFADEEARNLSELLLHLGKLLVHGRHLLRRFLRLL